MEIVFKDYEDAKTSSINHVYSVVKSMQNWIRSLPEYTKVLQPESAYLTAQQLHGSNERG